MSNGVIGIDTQLATSTPEPRVPLDDLIIREQVRLIYRQGSVLVVGASLCGLLFVLFLWHLVPLHSLLLWFCGILLTTAIRLGVIRAYHHGDRQARDHRAWGRLFWIGTLAAGIIWGLWPLLFYTQYNTEYLLMVSTVFAGLVAVSAGAGSVYPPAFLSFAVPLSLPLSIAHLRSGDELLVLIGWLLPVFLLVNGVLAMRGNRHYRELITARFENQALLEQLEEEKGIAERAVIAKNRFLAAASHDLRQPLHAMGLFIGSLRNREHDPRQLDIIDDLARSAEDLNGLFNSLLDVSRLDADVIEVHPVPVLVGELFAALRAQCQPQAEAKGLVLDVGDSDAVMQVDPVLLQRVLRNLLDNAIRYTEQGSISLQCEPADATHCRLVLSDTGVGIPAEAREEVFAEYYQIGNPERDRAKGLGLGLSIVRRLCRLTDIPLAMQSSPGEGTRFELLVPFATGRAAPSATPRDAATRVSHASPCILLIDDDVPVLRSMTLMLEDWGCRVLAARTGREALKAVALSDEPPVLILSDYRLPGAENGVAVVALLRETLERAVPAALITGDTSPERLKDVAASELDILHKPVDPHDLHALLRRTLRAPPPVTVDQDDTQTLQRLTSGARVAATSWRMDRP